MTGEKLDMKSSGINTKWQMKERGRSIYTPLSELTTSSIQKELQILRCPGKGVFQGVIVHISTAGVYVHIR
jgi:hypothetical protein